jgi:SAM-dependent methyltransferase
MVIGCDVAVEGVLYGQRSYMSDNLTFAVGDGTSLPFVDDAFDIVVTFETLEHIPDDRGFLSELHRVLRPGGEIILSTPNASITSRYPRNPFHIREYTLAQLHDLLEGDFCSLEFFAQAPTDRYAVSPFLPGHDAASGVGQSLQLIAWKVLRRLPHRWADALARALLRRRLYPGENDFAFRPDSDSGHVIVARGIAR